MGWLRNGTSRRGPGAFLGVVKVSSGHYFTMPGEAVMECLKRRGEEPDRINRRCDRGAAGCGDRGAAWIGRKMEYGGELNE